jgi:hypothetical protein
MGYVGPSRTDGTACRVVLNSAYSMTSTKA